MHRTLVERLQQQRADSSERKRLQQYLVGRGRLHQWSELIENAVRRDDALRRLELRVADHTRQHHRRTSVMKHIAISATCADGGLRLGGARSPPAIEPRSSATSTRGGHRKILGVMSLALINRLGSILLRKNLRLPGGVKEVSHD